MQSASAEAHSVESLYRDCRDLANYIARARREIARMRPESMKAEKLPRAGQELDAIVKSTEEATHGIMEAAEEMMAADSGDVESYRQTVDDACMRIIEACAFQDITGQRVNKVVQTINYIEERLGQLQAAWGPDIGDSDLPEEEPESADGRLLNGPALDGEGIDQSAVDALMGDSAKSKDEAASQADIDALFD